MLLLEKTWSDLLAEDLKKPYIADLRAFIQNEVNSGKEIYPPMEEVFSAFQYTPFGDVKVVIVGQDPYHGPGQAEGLCFSVKKGVPIPPSLRNIYKELAVDVGMPMPDHGSLISWARQGVLLLNTTLTVQRSAPKSHYGRGWEQFTDSIIKLVASRKDPVVFFLWGRSAMEKCERIGEPHIVLKSSHPSPFSATGFFGCKHFSQTNAWLEKWGKEPIDWTI